MHPWPLVEISDYSTFVTGLDADLLIEEEGHILRAHKHRGLWFVAKPGGGGTSVNRFLVVEGSAPWGMQPEYFTAVKAGVERDPDTNLYRPEDLVKIAKPWMLRRSTSDGRTRYLNEFRVTVQYTFDLGGIIHNRRTARLVELQHVFNLEMIWPEYSANDIINAQHLGEEGTDVEGVEWEDMNETGRVWSVLPLGLLPQ
jgi:hypothetical protein